MARGLLVNVVDAKHDRYVDRDQVPCFYVDDGTPVFEVWFWHCILKRWFCMSTVSDPKKIAQGVVYFWPGDIEGLKRTMEAMTG